MARKQTTDELLALFCNASPNYCDGVAIPSNLLFILEEKRFYVYQDPVWKPLDRRWLHSRMLRYLTDAKANGQIHEATNITAMLIEQLSNLLETNVSETNTLETTRSPWVATLTGTLFNLVTGETAPPELQHAFCRVPCALQEIQEPTEPKAFLKFLRGILVKKENTKDADEDLILFVQEMMGYFLLDTTKADAAFFFVGSGANGKSRLMDVIEAVVGADNAACVNLESLSSNTFAAASLVGKRINIVRDEESDRVKSDVLKSLITGEKIKVEEKYEKAFAFVPRARFLFSSNDVPTFKKIDHGLLRRLYFLPFYRRFNDGEKNPNILDPVMKELHLVAAWSILGLSRLIMRRYQFNRTRAMLEQQHDFETEQSSSLDFFSSTFVKDEDLDNGFSWASAYAAYAKWSEAEGRKTKGKIAFIKEIKDKQNSPKSFPFDPFWLPRKSTTVRGFRGYKLTPDTSAWIHSAYTDAKNDL